MSVTTATISVPNREWHHDGYCISTDKSKIPLSSVHDAFQSDQLYWTNTFSEPEIRLMIDSSACFGVYTTTTDLPNLIGLARLVTDNVTFAYLTDVYILPEHQGHGLGTWLIECVKEYIESEITQLRCTLLITGDGKAKFYAQKLGTGRMEDHVPGARVYWARGRGSTLPNTS